VWADPLLLSRALANLPANAVRSYCTTAGSRDSPNTVRVEPWGGYAYLSCMDGIAFGCMAALVSARQRMSRSTLRVLLAAGATITCLVLVLCNEDARVGLSRFGLNVTVLEAGVAMMLLAFGAGVGTAAPRATDPDTRRSSRCERIDMSRSRPCRHRRSERRLHSFCLASGPAGHDANSSSTPLFSRMGSMLLGRA
jgi:hypothetical protein